MPGPFQALYRSLKKEGFQPTWKGAFIHPFYIIRRALFVHVRELAPALHGRVLDIGCGSKPYADLFTRAADYVGVDVEQSGHDHSNSKVDLYYDGRRLPFDDGAFDAVVSFETFEHIFNLDEILDEIARVSKADGQLLVSVPFAWAEHEQPYDCARYTSFGIAWKLAEHGYRIVELRKSGSFIPALTQLWTAYLHQHVAPRNRVLGALFQLAFIAPSTVVGLALGRLLPRRDDYYCNLVVLARRDPAISPRETLEAAAA